MSEHTNTNQVALVTGATSGIGQATAFALADAGFEVVAHGRDIVRGAGNCSCFDGGGPAAQMDRDPEVAASAKAAAALLVDAAVG